MRAAAAWAERHQVALYVAAIAVGAAVGLLWPAAAPALSAATTPVLALLLLATFLGVPLADAARAFGHGRFLVTLLVVNFAVVPLVVFALSRFVADHPGLLLGVLLVLLTPCIDYVIVFTRLAGGAHARLLAATPLLMVLQLLLLPGYLWLIAGGEALARVEPAPFVEAFLLLIVAPLAAAAVVQALARRRAAAGAVSRAAGAVSRASRAARAVERASPAAMVPLMMATLAVVVGSQIAAVGGEAPTLLRLVPLYAAFLAIMLGVGLVAARLARLPVPEARAVAFGSVTRNSLVVLPLALALPAPLQLAPLAVVTQTLVELVGMVVLIRLVPALAPDRPGRSR